MILCGRIEDLPESVNDLYERTKWGIRKSDKGKAFQNRCMGVVRDLMLARRFQTLPPNVGWLFRVVIWLPDLETDVWKKKGDVHARFVRRDTTNFVKLAEDSIYRALGRDDSTGIKVVLEKRNGYGKGWIDFMLREMPVADPKNNTELTQVINDRRNLIRASPSDPALLLEDLVERPDNGTDYRLTSFDAWRIEIMIRLLERFSQVQSRLGCPARTGKLNSCFKCTDMMVIHCIMSNPMIYDQKGKAFGIFDLTQAKTGTYRSTVDRPQGGEGMETKVNPSAEFNNVVLMLSEAEADYRNMAKALKSTYDVLSAVKEQPGNQEICTKLAVILTDALEAGAGKGPTHSILYYRDITSANMPEPVAKAIAAAGSAYKYCAGLYGKLRALYAEWAGANGVATGSSAKPKEKPEKAEEATTEAEEAADDEEGDDPPEPAEYEPDPTPPVPRAKARVKPVPIQDA